MLFRKCLSLQLTIKSYIVHTQYYGPFVVITIRSFPHSLLVSGFITRVTRWVPLVGQELFILPGQLRSLLVLCGFHGVARSLVFCVMFCKYHCLFSRLSWQLWYMSVLRFTAFDCPVGILDLRLLIDPLVSQIYGF